MNEVRTDASRRFTLTTSDLAAAMASAGQEPYTTLSEMFIDGVAAETGAGVDWPDTKFRDRVLRALAAPPSGHARLLSVDQVEHIIAFRDGVCLSWIAGAPDVALAAPLAPGHAATAVLELLAPTEAAPIQPLTLEVRLDALMPLAACIDYLRFAYAASLVQRSPVQSLAVSREDLVRQIADAAAFDDNRWLCALVKQLVPDLTQSADQSIDSGVEFLCANALLSPIEGMEGAFLLPDTALIRLALNVITPLPAVLLETPPHRRLILVGRSLWALEVEGQHVTVRGIDGLDAIGLVQAAFRPDQAEDAGRAQQTEPRSAETSQAHCPSCGERRTKNQKFCTGCGVAFADA